jgi:hypothetical protein
LFVYFSVLMCFLPPVLVRNLSLNLCCDCP